jgi:L-ascorbate metabolism protein UlaG (beta-lactamase superfamily)
MHITFLGHSSFLLETGGKSIVLDPFISGNPEAASVDINSIVCDYIFLSHAHFDHTADVVAIMTNNPEAVIVGIWEVHDYYSKKGYKTHPMNIGGWWTFDFGRVKMVNAVHSSSFNDGADGGSPAGYVFSSADGTLYFAGDTALTMDMHLIPMTCPPLDVAILPVGSNFTMDYHDALIASDFIKCNTIVGSHFDTFGFIKINHEEATNAFEEKGKELILMEIGETREY